MQKVKNIVLQFTIKLEKPHFGPLSTLELQKRIFPQKITESVLSLYAAVTSWGEKEK